MSEHIQFDYLYDNHFAELKEAELMTNRLALLAQVEPYVGRYYSTEYVRRKVLQQKDQEIIEIDMQIEDEIERGIIPDPNEMMLQMEPGMPGAEQMPQQSPEENIRQRGNDVGSANLDVGVI